ncbi:MAG: tyrosine-type recombinase/integrase [Roseobacter sp.]
MSHIQYTIRRSGTFYYNRRVPKQAVDAYGAFVRVALSKDPDEAADYAHRLTTVLEGAWRRSSANETVDVNLVVDSFKPRSASLGEMAEEYLALREIEQKPSRLALSTFVSLAGDRDVREYQREDAKLFVQHLLTKGNKTATVRRRVNSISAILNYAYSELDVDKRNPFSRLFIKGEGYDTTKRNTFTEEQLRLGYETALASKSKVKLLMPILGETGCRLAEIVGLRVEDCDLETDTILIRPNRARRLKTRNSERTLPLVGYARLALANALDTSEGEWVFAQYIKDDSCFATHASNALNKWLKSEFGGLTAHCLRHTMRDRLRAVECPVDLRPDWRMAVCRGRRCPLWAGLSS